jgi:diguanylate cyclase (GGDEF)-like protein
MKVFSDLGGLGAPFIAGFVLLRAALGAAEVRRAWILCGIGTLAWGVGDSVWTFYELVLDQDAPLPSMADVFYLSGYGFLFLGALGFSRQGSKSLEIRTALDALAVTLAGTALIWRVAVEPVFLDSSAADTEKLLAALYPLGDVLILLALSLAMFRHRDGRAGTVFGTLTLGLFLILASDVIFAHLQSQDAYASGSIVDAGWTEGYVALGIAGLLQMRWKPRYQSEKADLDDPAWKQGFPLAVMIAVASWVILDGFEGQAAAVPMVVSVLLMMCAVVLRHLFTLHENLELRFRLERAYAQERERARRDPLTGVLNRGAILDTAAEVRREGDSLALVIADLDGMKAINDSYGHQAGDEALVQAARALSTGDAVVGRYGGDEFLVLLRHAGPTEANLYRLLIEARLGEARHFEHNVSLSLGFAFAADGTTTVQELIYLADADMYRNKRTQRERRKSSPLAA